MDIIVYNNHFLLFLLAPVVNNWNISILSVKSSSISVSWASYVPDPPYTLALYAVVCTPTNQDAGPTVAIAKDTQTQLEVLRLRDLTEYSVQVLAVTVHAGSGAFSFKGSNILAVNTVEGGKYWS